MDFFCTPAGFFQIWTWICQSLVGTCLTSQLRNCFNCSRWTSKKATKTSRGGYSHVSSERPCFLQVTYLYITSRHAGLTAFLALDCLLISESLSACQRDQQTDWSSKCSGKTEPLKMESATASALLLDYIDPLPVSVGRDGEEGSPLLG